MTEAKQILTHFPTDVFINYLAAEVHDLNTKWWHDPATGQPIERNVGEMLCLVHSEISEALEGHRKNLMDDHLPHRKMLEVELADAIIRILDIAAGLKLDLGGAFVEKMQYNATRADHSDEARCRPNGRSTEGGVMRWIARQNYSGGIDDKSS